MVSPVRGAFRPSTVPTTLTAGCRVTLMPEDAKAGVDERVPASSLESAHRIPRILRVLSEWT